MSPWYRHGGPYVTTCLPLKFYKLTLLFSNYILREPQGERKSLLKNQRKCSPPPPQKKIGDSIEERELRKIEHNSIFKLVGCPGV